MSHVLPPIVGRSAELAALDDLLSGTATGRFGLAIVEGEPGIGKTSLLRAALARAAERGGAVAGGAATETGRGAPFVPVLEALRGASHVPQEPLGEIREILLEPRDEHESARLLFRVVERLVDVVEAVVLRRPLILCLDDVQWADEGTLALLDRLPRRFAYAPLAVVLGRRTFPRSPGVDALVARVPPPQRMEVHLQPLTDGDVAEIADDLLPARPGPVLRERLTAAGGNPLLVVELLSALVRDEAVQVEGGVAETAAHVVPVSLSAVVRRRLNRLPEDAAELVRAAAVLGDGFSVSHLRAALEWPPRRLAAALAAALEERLLEEREDGVAFRHHLIRDVIHDELPEAVRRSLHLAAADASLSSGAPAAQVAAHLEAAAALGEARAAEWLRRAARESVSPSAALDYLERALALPAASPAAEELLLAEHAQALLWAGRPVEAESAARGLLPRVRDPARAALVLRVLFRSLLVQGKSADVLQLADAQLERLPARDRGLLLAEMAYMLTEARHAMPAEAGGEAVGHGDATSVGRGTRARELAEEALAVGEQLEDPELVCLSLCALSSVLDTQGRFAEAAELTRRAAAVADEAPGDEAQRHAPHFHLALQLVLGDRLSEAEAVATQGLARAEAAGVAWALPLHHYLLGRVHFAAGRWDDALADWETALALGEEVGTQMIVGDAAQAFLAQLALHRGDLRAADAHTAAAHTAAAREAALPQDPEAGVSLFALWARALVDEARGRSEEAAAAAAEIHRLATRGGWLALYRVVGLDTARITAAAGQREAAREIAAAMEELALRSGSPTARAAARLARGHAHGDSAALVEAAEAYGGSEVVVERAAALADAGAAIRDSDPDRGAGMLQEALRLYEGMGAARLVARVEALLAAAGRAPRRRGRPRREGVGWNSLTDAERRVAALVALGLSNAQVAETLVISPRTVQTHVGHIFTKLGMSNRAQLAAEAARRSS